MNYVEGRKNIGGMQNSIGMSQQDCSSIKFLFEYLENGLEEISFESLNDFCIVLDGDERLYFQVKVNQFTLPKVSELLRESNMHEKTIFIGSGYDDKVRNLLQYKERYLQAKQGLLNEDKEKLFKEMKDICHERKIDVKSFLRCDFFVVESTNRIDIAKSAIEKWARNKNIYINVDNLFNELIAIIGNRLRTTGGKLSKNEIMELIKKHNTSKIESFISKKDRISSVIEKEAKKDIASFMDDLIMKYKDLLDDKLLLIKYFLENDQLVEAKNKIKNILNVCQDLEAIYLMILNIMGEYDTVIEREDLSKKEDCILEFAKAHMYKKEFTQSLDCLSRVDKSKRESTFFYISGINHNGLEDVEKAKEDLNKSIELDDKNIDAYVFLASLIYTSDTELATEYLDIALYLDPEYPKAYYVRAQISQLSDDFSAVIENCEKYISYSGDFENESVLLMLATNKFHLKVNGWQMQFLKWDRVFRKNHNIVGENKMSILDWGREYMCPFFIHSNENEVTVFLGEKELFSAGIGMSRTAIGLYSPEIDKKLLEFSLKEENNPIRKSSKAIFDEVALPIIAKIYNDYKSYQQVVESLLKEEVLYLNHDFSEHIKEYVIEKDDVEVNMQVIGNKLIGDARIGNFWMRLEIDPLTINIDRFVEQLNKDCGHNEAAILLTCDEKHEIQITFPKEKMKLTLSE